MLLPNTELRIIITAASNDGDSPDGQARLFDTANPVADVDLGSPNKECGGPGEGDGGAPGRPEVKIAFLRATS